MTLKSTLSENRTLNPPQLVLIVCINCQFKKHRVATSNAFVAHGEIVKSCITAIAHSLISL